MIHSTFAAATTAAPSSLLGRRSWHPNPIFSHRRFYFPVSRPLVVPCVALETSAQSGDSNGETEKESKLWGGRFEEKVNEVVEWFTESISFEAGELWMHDITGSKAHANMLAAQVLTYIMILTDCRSFKHS